MLQLYAKIKKGLMRKIANGVGLLYVAQPFSFVCISPGLIFRQDLHAPLACTIFGFFPDPGDGTAIPCAGYVKIAS
jgi:hypothetical protein